MKKFSRLFVSVVFAALSPLAHADQAAQTTITLTSQTAGVTPFIAKLTLTASDLSNLRNIVFTIAPKPGSVTRPLSATYAKSYLEGRGYVDSGAQQLTIPVFGLYSGYTNSVMLTCSFADGSSKNLTATVQTEPFNDPQFSDPTVVQARTATPLSYDYILVAKTNSRHSPTIIDTDGAIRWVGTVNLVGHYTTFYQNGIYLGAGSKLYRMELDGQVNVVADYASLGVVGFHHNIDPGKYGIILDVNTTAYVSSVHLEVDAAGRVLKKWNLADIIGAAMIAGGDDPTGFVRRAKGRYDPGAFEDWTHDNAVAYRKSDDSIIISSRENFVICLDYDTGAIKWIFGDPSKAWYQYPSLRKFALTAAPGTIAPVGQHTVSITYDDHLLLFDNGEPSYHQQPAGAQRSYSAGREYQLDLEANVATEVWTFDDDQSVRSPTRSSIYADAPGNHLVDYAVAKNPDGSTRGEVLGLAPSGEKVFHYRYPAANVALAYRSVPIHWEDLRFPAQTNVRLGNISARSQVKTGDDVGIAGFIVSGPVPKTVILRGLGPSLQNNGQAIAGRLMDPQLDLYDSSGHVLQSNDSYKDGPDAAAITQAGLAPPDDSEAAIMMELSPGAYTTVLRGKDNTIGIGLVEVFDLSPGSTSQLGNLSARAFNSTGDNVLISGVILQGDIPRRLLFRALGPELQSQGIANAFDDTTLDVFDADGTKIQSNDDWRQAANSSQVEATGIAPTDDREAAILMPATSGSYTCIARGKAETGVILLEAYRLD